MCPTCNEPANFIEHERAEGEEFTVNFGFFNGMSKEQKKAALLNRSAVHNSKGEIRQRNEFYDEAIYGRVKKRAKPKDKKF